MTPLVTWGPTVMVALTLALGVVYQTHHFDKQFEDLREHFNKRFDDQRDFIRAEVLRLENRIERLERPVYRP
ncbi:MAG: hypothetical protein ACR2JB_06425 [Bryobacteraceae bacterium]